MYGVELGLEWGASHIMFMGADQVHELDILEKFVNHIKNGWKLVTALTPVRGRVDEGKPFQPVGWKRVGGKFELIDPSDAPYQEIDAIGSGTLLFDVEILKGLKKPWFSETVVDKDYNRDTTMDTKFSYRLVKQSKSKILCDCTIGVKHLDIFPIDPSYGDRFSDWPVPSRENHKKKLSDMYQPGGE
jgi:hypothetical protein